MDFVHFLVWQFHSFIQQYPAHAYDLKVKVTDLKVLY